MQIKLIQFDWSVKLRNKWYGHCGHVFEFHMLDESKFEMKSITIVNCSLFLTQFSLSRQFFFFTFRYKNAFSKHSRLITHTKFRIRCIYFIQKFIFAFVGKCVFFRVFYFFWCSISILFRSKKSQSICAVSYKYTVHCARKYRAMFKRKKEKPA